MKKIIFTLAAFAALSLSAATRQDPPPTQVTYHGDCPATVTANTVDPGGVSRTETYTSNKSTTHDARTVVTDSQGYQQSYTTKANNNTYQYAGKINENPSSHVDAGKNPNVSKIDVYCSPAEKK